MSQDAGEIIMPRGWELVQIKVKRDRTVRFVRLTPFITQAFTAWVNGILAKRDSGTQISDIRTDLSDGVKFIWFLELLSGKKITQKYNANPPLKIQKIQNLNIAFTFIKNELDPNLVKLSGVGVEGIHSSAVFSKLSFSRNRFCRRKLKNDSWFYVDTV